MNEQDRPTITIKLKPYLQEYLICELKSDVAHKTNLIGKLLKPLLEIRPKGVAIEFNKGPEYIRLGLPYNDDLNIRGNLWYIAVKTRPFSRSSWNGTSSVFSFIT